MLKCYIAGKLNADAVGYIKNVHSMIRTAKKVRELGIAVYVPCNDFLEGVVSGEFTYQDYFDNSQPWLKASDFMFVCEGWETSEGTNREIRTARELGMPVFFDIEKLKHSLNHQEL